MRYNLNLKSILEERNMNPYQLSKLTGIAPNTISRMITRDTDKISLVNLAKIAEALRLELTDLLIEVYD